MATAAGLFPEGLIYLMASLPICPLPRKKAAAKCDIQKEQRHYFEIASLLIP